jgi:N-acetylneuraminic acid mutarotase/glucose/arabinose dehydrogenase
VLAVEPLALDYGPVPLGGDTTRQLTLRNAGTQGFALTTLRFFLGSSGNSADFSVTIGGNTYDGAASNQSYTLVSPINLGKGQEVVATVRFEPTEELFHAFTLLFESPDDTVSVPVSGLGGHAGDPFLHVVIEAPAYAVDYDGNGTEPVTLDGSGSHTHEPGHVLTGYVWRINGSTVSTSPTLSTTLPSGETEIDLEIIDDNTPSHTLTGQHDVSVVPMNDVPGVLTYYYEASANGPTTLLDSVPPTPDFLEQRSALQVTGVGHVGGSPYTQSVLVRLVGRIQINSNGTYTFSATGGVGRRLFVGGALVTAPVFLVAGEHSIEARFAVDVLSDLPLEVQMASGGPLAPIPADRLSHDETAVPPVIHSMTNSGSVSGGTPVTIEGFGFFPAAQVVVHWGDALLDSGDFTALGPKSIQFPSPAGGGAVAVHVTTPNGNSNVRTFSYDIGGPVPIQFVRERVLAVPQPTAAVWGPDRKLYVASLDGRITAIDFGPNYEVLSQTIHAGVSNLSNHEALGLTINPYDPPSPVKLYVAHGDLFVNGGTTPTGPSPYTGQISVLTGPNFNSPVAKITGLPVSNHDHAINGIVFDHNGDLFIPVGSMTNAGVADPDSGDLPECALSCAVLKALTSKPGFNGTITYVDAISGLNSNDQRFGQTANLAAGIDVEVHASGVRNAYGLVLTTSGRLYATDNGPNIGFGAASTGPNTQTADPFDDDEVLLIEWGNYYGSPNRNRGRTDARQNVYYGSLAGPASIADTFTQMIGWVPASTDGIDEYRSDTFQGQMRGNLVVQKYLNRLRRLRLSDNGRALLGNAQIDPNTVALGCITGPDGAILSIDHGANEVEVLLPNDLSPAQHIVHDIFPWRAPATGGMPFVIAGRGFGTLANTAVTIGGNVAALTEVSWGRIKGTIPAETTPGTGLVDIVVTVGTESDTLPQAFRYLLGVGLEPGHWESLANLSTPLGEVSAGVINGTFYAVGEGSGATLAYDALNRQWLSNKASRPLAGNHHSAEVVGGKLYLIGGLGGGSEGKVQIYNPATNSWSMGADMPWGGGSVSTAVIDGKIFAAGGIVGSFTVSNCAVYDPALDQWTNQSAMPDQGRNHAAAGTDGTKLYVFGGRRGGNFVANGYDSVMIYTPSSNTWTWNGAVGSTLAPLPEARGGMGKAVFYRGEFYVFGGETQNDPDANANHVYDRVDVYRPATNTWRLEAPMPSPRHGIYPVLFQGHMLLAGGGTQSAFSQSTVFDDFTRQ